MLARTRRVGQQDGSELFALGREYHAKGDGKKAVDLYTRAVKLDHPKAFNALGVCSMTGVGMKKPDKARGIELFTMGASKGDASSMVNLANALQAGDGVGKDEQKAFEWFERAASLGDEDALFAVGVAMLEGRGTIKDENKAYTIFSTAVEAGYWRAFVYLGICLAQGLGGAKRDNVKARELFEQAIAHSDPRGMYHLALLYQHGIGVEVDLKKSLELHKRAWNAPHRFVDSLWMLGVFYSTGTEVLMDEQQAVLCFQSAAKLGHIEATNQLGKCYLNGRGVSKDANRAYELFRESAEAGNTTGMVQLGNLHLNGIGVTQDESKAYELFQTAAQHEDIEAICNLGLCLLDGNGVQKDVAKGLELLTKAGTRKSARALYMHAQYLETDISPKRDMNLILDLYRKATLEGHKAAGDRFRELIVETLPDSVKQGGKKQLDQFVQDIIDGGSVGWSKVKVMVLGKEGVGKTALYHMVRGIQYNTNLSTDGIDMHSFKVKEMDLIWFDFGGQTIFYPTHQFFLTARCIYMICFKFGDDDSIERVKYWLQDLQALSHDPSRRLKVVIVGTHADQLFDEKDQEAVFGTLDAASEALGHVVGHIAVDCTTGLGLKGVRRGLEMAIEAAQLQVVQIPRSYSVIAEFIKESRQDKPRMDWAEVVAALPAISERQLEGACQFFTDVGMCVYDRDLRIFVSDPQWLAKTFSSLVSFSHQWLKDGTVTTDNLHHVWKGSSEAEISQMMSLFEKFGIAFLKRANQTWVIPSLLADSSTGDRLQFGPPRSEIVLQERVFTLEFIPFGLFGRLIARLQSWCDDTSTVTMTHVWQTGVILKSSNGDAAEFSLDADRKALVLRVVSASSTIGNGPSGNNSGSWSRAAASKMSASSSRDGSWSRAAGSKMAVPSSPRDSNGVTLSPRLRNMSPPPRPQLLTDSSDGMPEMPSHPPAQNPTLRKSANSSVPTDTVSRVPQRSSTSNDDYSEIPPSIVAPLPPSQKAAARSSRVQSSTPRLRAPAPQTRSNAAQLRSSCDAVVTKPMSSSRKLSPRSSGARALALPTRSSATQLRSSCDAVVTKPMSSSRHLSGTRQRAGKSFFVQITEHIDGLLNVVLVKSGALFETSIACVHCLRDENRFKRPTYFALAECIKAVVGTNTSSLRCGVDALTVNSLDDDITFRYVTVFHQDNIVLDDKPFAAGGFGNIYKGRFIGSGHSGTVVAKELTTEKAKDAFSELQHETSVMSDLKHANLLRLYGVMLQPLRMLLEFCEAGDLLHALRGGRIDSDALRHKIALDSARGLKYLHSQKPPFAHRDLRSPNVLLASLDPKSSVCAKICDFGLTLRVIEPMQTPLPTWQWMSPEAQLGDHYTETCDLYSLGIVLFELFDGKGEVPFSEFIGQIRTVEMFALLRAGTLRPTLPQGLSLWMKVQFQAPLEEKAAHTDFTGSNRTTLVFPAFSSTLGM